MKKFLEKDKIRDEKGAATVLVLFTVLIFVIILMGSYFVVTSLTKSQLKSDLRIQDIYGEQVEKVDEIYEERIDNQMKQIYTKDKLLLLTDCIHNTRRGNDKTATMWEDLSGNKNDINLVNIKVNNDNSLSAIDQTSKAYIDINIPESFTIEIVFKYYNTNNLGYLWKANIEKKEKYFYLWNYSDSGTSYSYRYKDGEQWNVNDNITGSLIENNKKNCISITFDRNTKESKIYYDGEYIKTVKIDLYENEAAITNIFLMNSDDIADRALINGGIYSFRVYNKVLEDNEVLFNYNTDKERFNM